MSISAAKTFFDNVDDEAKEWLANALFYRELETIRLKKPLLDTNTFKVIHVKIYNDDAKPSAAAVPPTATARRAVLSMRGGSVPRTTSSIVIRNWNSSQFHRDATRLLAKMANIIDSDENAPGRQVLPPGPLTDMRKDIPALSRKMGYSKSLAQQFPKEVEAAKVDFLTSGYEHMDQEAMLNGADWLRYLLTYHDKPYRPVLYKGFPMVEDVVFVKHPNYWISVDDHKKLVHSGQCYWLALALLLYGDASFWLRVKAEHLNYLEKVLLNPKHPRHAFYTRLNGFDTKTQATGPAYDKNPATAFNDMANMWEILQIPGCWTNDDTCVLTADVYGLFLVLYRYDTNKVINKRWQKKVYDMKTYGAYNSRHIFLCYTEEKHFQPMLPNDYCAYEFKLPRPTLQSTKKYSLVTTGKHRRRLADGLDHYCRGDGRKTIPTPLSQPSFEQEHLARAVGYGPYVNKSAAPAPSPAQPQPAPIIAASSSSTPGPVQPIPPPARSPAQRQSITQANVQAVHSAWARVRQLLDSIAPGSGPTSGRKRPAVAAAAGEPSSKRLRSKRDSDEDEDEVISIKSTPPRSPSAPVQPQAGGNKQGKKDDGRGDNKDKNKRDEKDDVDIISLHTTPPASPPLQDNDDDDGTFWRKATKSVLAGIKVVRLRKWCATLGLAKNGEDESGWLKKVCVDKLLAVGVEVRMRKVGGPDEKGPGAGWSVVVGEGEGEDVGVVVVRILPRGEGGGDGDGQ